MIKARIIIYLIIIIFLIAVSFWYNFLFKGYKLNKENYLKSKGEIRAKINEIREKIIEMKKIEEESKYNEIENKKIIKNNIELGECLKKIIEIFNINNVKVIELVQLENSINIKFIGSYNNFYNVIYGLIDNEYVINIEEFKITDSSKEQKSNKVEGYIILSFENYGK